MAQHRSQLFTSSLRAISTTPYVSPLRCALSQTRSFRNTAALRQQLNVKTTAQPQPSMRVQLSKHMLDNIPNDIGLLPHTFILPHWRNLVPLVKTPKRLWLLTKGAIRSKLGILAEYGIFKWKSPMKFEYFAPPKEKAIEMYEEMYKHLAEGDLEKLKAITGSGLLEKFMKQIAARPLLQNQKLVWECRNLKAKRVSNRAFHFWGQGIEVRQVVYRMESFQQLKKVKVSARDAKKITGVAPGIKPQERKVVEYVVFQKKKIGDTPETDWYLWGTIDETTPEKLMVMTETLP